MRRTTALLASIALGVLAAAAAQAQTAPPAQTTAQEKGTGAPELEGVIITARKRAERLNDVPIAASVETGAELLQRGTIANTEQALTGIAGLNFNGTSPPSLDEVTLRGSGAALSATGADSGIGIYRNGIFSEGGLFFSHTFSRADFFDVDQIEVLRGTQGALYGRDAVGGSINVISARPTFDYSGRASVDYNAGVDSVDAQAVLNAKVTDHIAVRLGADFIDQREGFLYDESYKNYEDQDHGQVVRGQVRYQQGGLDMTFLAERLEERLPMNTAQVDYPAGAPVSIAGGFAAGYENPQYTRYSSTVPLDISNVTNLIYNGTYKFDFATLSVNYGYRDAYTRGDQDADLFDTISLAIAKGIPGNTGAGVSTDENLFVTVHTSDTDAEAHLAGQEGRFNWLVGGEYLDLRSKAGVDQMLNAAITLIRATSDEHWKSWASFASLGYDIIPTKLSLTLDGRYTDDVKDQFRLNLLTGAYVLAPMAYKQNNFSYDATLGYHPWSQMLAYLKVGTGYRVGGANAIPLEASPPAPIAASILYGDETTLEFEAGLKGNPTRSTYVGIAVYQVTTNRIIVSENDGCTIALCHGVFPNFLTNAGTAHGYGVETEAKWFTNFAGGRATLAATLSNQSGHIDTGNFKGFRVPQEPNWIESFNIDYVHPVSDSVSVFGNLNFRAQQGGRQDVSTPNYGLDSRAVTDLRFGIRHDHIELAGYINNLTDDKWRDSITISSNLWDLYLRSMGVQLRVSF